MDVSATGQAAAAAVAQASVETVTGTVGAPAPQGTASTVHTTTTGDTHDSGSSSQQTGNRAALAPAVAKLFALPFPAAPDSLDVSYRIEGASDTIVTVFTDPKTGQEVAQFPPEVLIHLAQFFDQQHGATLDQSA